jgi:hypothetical protein
MGQSARDAANAAAATESAADEADEASRFAPSLCGSVDDEVPTEEMVVDASGLLALVAGSPETTIGAAVVVPLASGKLG